MVGLTSRCRISGILLMALIVIILAASCASSSMNSAASDVTTAAISTDVILEDTVLAGPSATMTKTVVNTAVLNVEPVDEEAAVTPEPVVQEEILQPESEKCREMSGTVETLEIESQALSSTLTFRVYTPPCFDPNKENGYPVLYLLHGQGFNDDQWDRLGVDEIASDMIISGCAVPFMMVMPWEEYNLVDPWESGFDQAILEDLIPWIDSNYPTCDERDCRAIGGISRGAAWAVRIGLMQWEYFGSIGAHSFPPFKNDFYLLPDWLRVFPSDQRPRIYVDIGTYDRNLKAANEFQTAFITYRLPYEWHSFEGMHDEEYWSAHVADYLQWYVMPWNLRYGKACSIE